MKGNPTGGGNNTAGKRIETGKVRLRSKIESSGKCSLQ